MKIAFLRVLCITLLSALLSLSIAGSAFSVGVWGNKIPTWCYVVACPNPVGVNQQLYILVFNPQVPPGATATNDIRYKYEVKITRPDGVTETYSLTSDSTGGAFMLYTPTMVGNYTIFGKFLELFYRWNSTSTERMYYGTIFLSSNYTTTLVVQKEPIEFAFSKPFPLPDRYWARPIEEQNTEWYRIASYWLNNAHDRNYGFSENCFQRDGIAPNSAHILWTKPIQDGGVVGGSDLYLPGNTFYTGTQYNMRMQNPVIMHGRLYYELPLGNSGGGGGVECVDLHTGETIWYNPDIGGTIFGWYIAYETMNQHGVIPSGVLFRVVSSTWMGYNPLTGRWMFNVTNIPSGFEEIGPKGEILRYIIRNYGTSAKPDWRLLRWNSTRIYGGGASPTTPRVVNASASTWYDFNVTIQGLGFTGFRTTPTIRGMIPGELIFGSNGTWPSNPDYNFPAKVTIWAISIKPDTRGQVIYMKDIEVVTPDNKNLLFRGAAEGVAVMMYSPTLEFVGYDMRTGQKLWQGPSEIELTGNPFGYYISSTLYKAYAASIAYGKLFTTGYTGHVIAYDLYTGKVLWVYSAPTNMTKFPYYPMFFGCIADGKIYIGTHEHSADTPLFKGHKIRCLDAETGKEIWSMYGWGVPQSFAVADGILVYLNLYDSQIYAVGKGPSATTVSVQNDVVPKGSTILLKGSVADRSKGTRAGVNVAKGTPAVSDEYMGKWMEYLYMQKPLPSEVKGVEVKLYAKYPDGSIQYIGSAVTDPYNDGLYALAWVPPTEGTYTITAVFSGSESYWPSQGATVIHVTSAPEPAPTPASPEQVQNVQSLIEAYGPQVTALTILVVVAIILSIANLYIHLKKK